MPVIKVARDLFYGGQWQQPKQAKYLTVVNPATQAELGEVANATADDVQAAVDAANQAFPSWAVLSPAARGDILRQAAATLLAHQTQLAQLDALDGGNPIRFMQKDIQYLTFRGM